MRHIVAYSFCVLLLNAAWGNAVAVDSEEAFASGFQDTESDAPGSLSNIPMFPTVGPKPFSNPKECDIVADSAICLNGGAKVIVPDAQPKDLALHLSFDDCKCLDTSGLRNHARNVIPPGPAMGGFGASAMFNGFDWVEVPHSTDFYSREFSVTFWMYLMKDASSGPRSGKGLRWCPLVQKGVDDNQKKTYDRSPAIFFDRRERALKAFVTTTENQDFPQGEFALSNARIPYQRWTHIAVVRLDKKIRLYVNGILDVSNITMGFTSPNSMPLYIGNTPWHKDDCNIPSLIDEFRFYKRPLTRDEIQAEAAPALGGIEPSFVRLGCVNCLLEEAAKQCAQGYHLCQSLELHTGGYQVARAMGWLDWSTHVWSHGALASAQLQGASNSTTKPVMGLGLCCSDAR
eukprot:GILJ01000231.1.p1 GENE.GILJ01000231.1~~GILJ01000231.1.p1  ORF type:complete len:402 (-),score=42.09 GILJ01000231.1:91-1296(-)